MPNQHTTPIPTEERFWALVNKSGPCWLWTGTIYATGYGGFKWNGARKTFAHRFAYLITKGAIPDGLQLDHLCRVRHCVNPDHLEAVSPRENTLRSPIAIPAVNARKTHCHRGHPLDDARIQFDKRHQKEARVCRPCSALKQQAFYWRRKAKKLQEVSDG